MRLEARAQVTFHIVTEGACWLRREGAAAAGPSSGGISAFCRRGWRTSWCTPAMAGAEPIERLLERRCILPTGGPVTTMVCGAYCLDAQLAEPMLRGRAGRALRREGGAGQPPLSAVMSLVTAELDRPGPGSEVLVQHLFDALFLYILRAWADGVAASAPGWLPALKDAALVAGAGQHARGPGGPLDGGDAGAGGGGCRARRSPAGSRPSWASRRLGYLTRWRMGLAPRGSCSRARPLWPRWRAGWGTSRSSPSAGPSSAAAGWPRRRSGAAGRRRAGVLFDDAPASRAGFPGRIWASGLAGRQE